jgi:hypothetical protein
VNVWVLSAVVALAGVAMIALVGLMVRDETAGDVLFGLLAVLELALLVQAVLGVVALSSTTRDVSGVLFVSYLVGALCALPVGAFWSLAERTRAGTAVLLVATFTVVAVELRLDAIWGGAGA